MVAEQSDIEYSYFMKGIGERVKSLRLKFLRPSSQAALAKLAGVNVETVNRIEHDQNAEIDSLLKIANGLAVTLGDLLPEDHWPKIESAKGALSPCCDNPEHLRLIKLLDDGLHSGISPRACEQGMLALMEAVSPSDPRLKLEHGPFSVLDAPRPRSDRVRFKKPAEKTKRQ